MRISDWSSAVCSSDLGSGHLHTTLTDTRSFDYAIHGDDDPSGVNARNAAIVNLFYMNNWLHDWWYDHGFDEQAGNAQTSNYGRGGVESDAISAQEIGRASCRERVGKYV